MCFEREVRNRTFFFSLKARVVLCCLYTWREFNEAEEGKGDKRCLLVDVHPCMHFHINGLKMPACFGWLKFQ